MNVPSPTRGASLRAPSREDAPAITALLDSIQRTLHGSSDVTEDRVRFVWRWPRFDLARDARMAFVEGALAGYAWIWGPRDPEPDWDGDWLRDWHSSARFGSCQLHGPCY